MDQGTSYLLRVNSFKGLQNLPLYVAMREGYFAARGIAIDLTFTRGSTPQLAGLARGEYDLIQTAPDNVINYDTQPAAFGITPDSAPHVAMVLGGSIGPLSVYARPGVADIHGLYGATLGVDNPTSGFALVLRDLLQRQGLMLERDYQFVVAGSTHDRSDALLNGTVAATILYSPFDMRAAGAGAALIASSVGTYAAYASGSTAGARPWIDGHGEIVTRYIAAILRALRWLYEPANAVAAQDLMRSEPSLGVAPDLISRAYAAFVAPVTGFGREGAIDVLGLRQVITLRAAYGALGLPLGEPEQYCDLRWYEAARAGLSSDS